MEAEDELSDDALAMLRDLEDPEQPNFVHTVLSRFLRESDELADRLVRAAKDRNAAGLCQTSHTLKSTGGIVGARTLAACCAKLELAAREGRVDEAVLLVETALLRLERVKPAIRRYIEAGPQSEELVEVTA
jgi:HPt (histidine-containing phosphotransfer) domain-containing protein